VRKGQEDSNKSSPVLDCPILTHGEGVVRFSSLQDTHPWISTGFRTFLEDSSMQRFFKSILPGMALLWMLSPISCKQEKVQVLPATKEAFRESGKKVTDAFMKALGQRLKAAIAEGGPSYAIEVCSKEAPKIAESFSTQKFRIHRIGTRVRNIHTGTPTLDERELLQKLSPKSPDIVEPVNGKLVYLRAIYLSNALCLKCHGDPKSIDPKTRKVLARLYPEDKATGYKLNDLRGAFVVRER